MLPVNWLSVLPIDEYGFYLHEGASYDAAALCHVWPLSNLPKSWVWGRDFQLSMLPHAPGEHSHLYGISSTNNVSER